jgi:hypothetical protein
VIVVAGLVGVQQSQQFARGSDRGGDVGVPPQEPSHGVLHERVLEWDRRDRDLAAVAVVELPG